MTTDSPAPSAVLVSADPDYLGAAGAELRSAFPGATVSPFGPDALRATGLPNDLTAVADRCREWPVVFARHLLAERFLLPAGAVRQDKRAVSRAAAELLSGEDIPADGIALQVWVSGESPLRYGTEELWHHLADELGRTGIAVRRSGATRTLGLCIGQSGIAVGFDGPLPGYADWPGGRIRLRKDSAQVSRAEFKLEELLALGVIDLPTDGLAIDLGAAPGGWTRIVRRAGPRVVAVDPGALDDRLANDDGISHVTTTAGPYLAQLGEPVDLVVNDMRMIPALSVELMLAASRHVRPGGLGVMTLKLTPHHALETIDRALGDLRRGWDVVFVRQLYHNRNEATVVLRR